MTKPAKVVSDSLQSALIDLIDLSLIGKQAHWNVHGPQFRSVHLELDEAIVEIRNLYDTVAERLAQLGVSPDGRPSTIVETSQVAEIEGGFLSADKVLGLVSERIDSASTRIKESLPALEVDLVSQDILIAVAAGLDKHAWFLRSAIK